MEDKRVIHTPTRLHCPLSYLHIYISQDPLEMMRLQQSLKKRISTACVLLKGQSTSRKMNVHIKWVIYVEEMRNYF